MPTTPTAQPGFAETQSAFLAADSMATIVEGDPTLLAMLRAAEASLAAARVGTGSRSRALSARVDPALLAAAARRLGTTNVSDTINAGLALIAGTDTYGAWLLDQVGGLPPDLEVDA